MENTQKLRQRFRKKKIAIWGCIALGLILASMLSFRLSPWPGALVIRTVFNKGGHDTLAAMEQQLPDYPVTATKDIQYKAGDRDALMDIYTPHIASGANHQLPVVVWTHGGAWLSGDKKDSAPYYERLANEGYVVVAVNYSLAPGATYPHAVKQLNEAHRYVAQHIADYDGDPTAIVLAGDSAGAQLSSQLAAIITNPEYAQRMQIVPALQKAQLRGVMLYCGIYKMEALTEPSPNLSKIVSWGDSTSVWAYTGSRNKAAPAIRQMSAYYHVTDDFPATFISGGNADPLTNAQSKPLAQKLESQGVDVTSLFYDKDHTPALPHEYQFTFNADGERAFKEMTGFLYKLLP